MILETHVSWFKSTYKTEVAGTIPLAKMLKDFKDGEYIVEVENLRDGDKTAKQRLETFAAHGIFSYARKANNFIESSGIIVLDFDDVEDDLQEVKEMIMEEDDHVLAAMISPSGTGIKALYYVDPDIVTKDNYRQIGKQVVERFEDYGKVDFMSITDCLIATYDPEILINDQIEPARIYIAESTIDKDAKLEERDESIPLWEDPEEFFETVLLESIEEKTNNNYHFIQVSTLDMAKFGFTHPENDLSFIIDYSESFFKVSKDNQKRFSEAAELAKTYPQVRWAYNTTKQDEDEEFFEEEEYDYSEFTTKDKAKSTGIGASKDNNQTEEEDEESGLINYENLFERVKEVIAEGDRVGFEVSFENFSNAFRPKGTGILTVTGIPGSGKTEFVDAITLDLARLHGHETIIAGFEQSPEEHLIKLMRKVVGADITCPSWNDDEKTQEAFEFITKYFKHIDTNKTGGNIHKILSVVEERILKAREEGEDPKYLVLDPFNMLSIKSKSSGHEKIEQILRLLTQFSHKMGMMIILVAHPFKMKKDEKTGEYEVPDFYSVKGSSAFFEMSYHGWVVYRRSDGSVMVKILKVKQNNMGTTGAECFFDYQRSSGRYIPLDEDGNELAGDHYEKDWLENILKKND